MQLSDRIGRRLKLQDLHVLMTVVQAGTMGKAAQQLNTTQPNISRAIAELEHAFAFHRVSRLASIPPETAGGHFCNHLTFSQITVANPMEPSTGEGAGRVV